MNEPPASSLARAVELERIFAVEDYLYFLEETLQAEDTPAQVELVERVLELRPRARVLDLGCGHGRHAVELARRGHEVLGVDAVEGFVALARARAAAEGVAATFARADHRRLEVVPGWDAALFLFDAFGFGDDADALASLASAHRALAPAGRLLLDLRARDLMARLAPVAVLEKQNGDLMIDRQRFDPVSGRFLDRRTTVRGGVRRVVEFSVRLYTVPEIRLLLALAGFATEAVLAGPAGAPFAGRILVAARRTDAPPLEEAAARLARLAGGGAGAPTAV